MGSLGTWNHMLSIGRLKIVEQAPYFRSVIYSLVPTIVEGLGTLGVTNNLLLIFNPKFIESLPSVEHIAGCLVHEVLHVCSGHTAQHNGSRDPRVLNIAQDLAINPSVIEMGFKLPSWACFPETDAFPLRDGFKRGLTAAEYYDLLLKRKEVDPGAASADGGGEGTGEIGRGRCGSCAAQKLPDEPTNDAAKSEAGARSEQEIERVMRATAEAVAEAAAQGRGNMPASLKRWAEQLLKPPVIPWDQKLKRAVRVGCAWSMGMVDHCYTKISRRQAGLGFGVGKPILPAYHAPRPTVDVILDTSGSMTTGDLNAAVVEINGILKSTNSTIRFCACDAGTDGVKKVASAKELLASLTGGGGTDMRPAFDALMQQSPKPSVIVCLTDGLVGDGFPKKPFKGVKVIIVIIGDGPKAIPNTEWAETINIPRGASRAA